MISGRMTDPSGGVLPGAPVLLKNLETGVIQKRTTNESGDYSFDLLDPGHYSISVALDGYKKLEITDIQVDVAGHVSRDLSLEMGSTAQTVEVVATAQQLEKSDSSIGTIVESKSIQELPEYSIEVGHKWLAWKCFCLLSESKSEFASLGSGECGGEPADLLA